MTAPASQLHISEAEWQSRVLDYAELRGWLCHHTRPARTANGWRTPVQGHKGFPDWVFARRGSLVIAELKTETGRLTPDEKRWLETLWTAHQQVYLWRPSDWDEIQKVLM